MGPLEGIKIIDFTQFMAGPLATQLLADLGCEVIKVERPGVGDAARQGSASPFTIEGERNAFVALNRNKRSVTIDLKHPDGRSVAQQLCQNADVVVENFRPGVMDRLGLSYERLCEGNPRLVYCAITGYGDVGPRAGAPGQDLLVQCVTGLAMMNGRRGDPPTPVGPPVIDAGTGHLAALAISAALYERERSGQGQRVGVSLTGTSLSLQSQEATLYLNTGAQPQRSEAGVANPYFVAPYGVYETADGHLALAHTSLPRLSEILDEPGLARYGQPIEVYEARDEIYRRLATRLKRGSTAEWLALLEPAGFWVAPVLDYEQFFDQFGDAFVCEMPGENGGVVRSIASPVRLERTPAQARTAPPRLGAHTAEVLSELGYDDNAIATLRSDGAI
jgi:crotonobetainyl-CoA:carnitine CoA-transferase CaiB-like acyl-CoA transferase